MLWKISAIPSVCNRKLKAELLFLRWNERKNLLTYEAIVCKL
ncbi:hypothetical protein IMSAGC011_01797 [Lachnospiraceae bacterium]|nr:hypothetical protein IMSAGC011_01797 [Lachnospiraceae bacterium]